MLLSPPNGMYVFLFRFVSKQVCALSINELEGSSLPKCTISNYDNNKLLTEIRLNFTKS